MYTSIYKLENKHYKNIYSVSLYFYFSLYFSAKQSMRFQKDSVSVFFEVWKLFLIISKRTISSISTWKIPAKIKVVQRYILSI